MNRQITLLTICTGMMFGSADMCTGADWQSALEQKAAKVRATAAELRWLEIPWASSPDDAIRQASEEGRPLLIFSVDGDPFDRC